jgi:hypothetical protein
VQIQALLGFRNHPVNKQLLLGELVDNRELVVREHCYLQGIQLLVVKNFVG